MYNESYYEIINSTVYKPRIVVRNIQCFYIQNISNLRYSILEHNIFKKKYQFTPKDYILLKLLMLEYNETKY